MLLTLGAHAPGGYGTCLCVSVSLSVTTPAAASFNSVLKLSCEQLSYGILLILRHGFS